VSKVNSENIPTLFVNVNFTHAFHKTVNVIIIIFGSKLCKPQKQQLHTTNLIPEFPKYKPSFETP